MKIRLFSRLFASLSLALFLGASTLAPGLVFAQGNMTGTTPSTPPGKQGGSVLNIKLKNPISADTIEEFLLTVVDGLILLITPIIFIMFIYSGFLFVKAGAEGEGEGLKKAKSAFTSAVIGSAIILGAKGIVLLIQNTVTQL